MNGHVTVLLSFNGPIQSGTAKRLVTLVFRTTGVPRTPITLTPESLQIVNGSGTELKVRLER